MDRVLIIDGDAGSRALLDSILSGERYQPEVAASMAEAQSTSARLQFHLVLYGRVPDGSDTDLLHWLSEHAPETPLVSIPERATSTEGLLLLVRQALDQRKNKYERKLLREEQALYLQSGSLITRDPAMTRVLELAAQASRSDASILLTGEIGAGQEELAYSIHGNSPRGEHAFVALNCAVRLPALLETDLFGRARNGSPGRQQHAGLLERAHGGSLFLEGLAGLDDKLQSTLLRVLESHVFERAGDPRQITADVRVIAAASHDLKPLVAEGRFRGDLLKRLSTFHLEIPPLRKRQVDIPRLAQHFLERAATDLGKPVPALTPRALDLLVSCTWPGNARELKNLMERIVLLNGPVVDARDLSIARKGPCRPATWREIEREAIEEALWMSHGNRTQAARQLRVSLRTLQYRLKEYASEK